jgi:hypothetical protein
MYDVPQIVVSQGSNVLFHCFHNLRVAMGVRGKYLAKRTSRCLRPALLSRSGVRASGFDAESDGDIGEQNVSEKNRNPSPG